MDQQQIKSIQNQLSTQLNTLKPEDVVIFDSDVLEENYTIVLRFNKSLLGKIQQFINELKQIDSQQYYYPENQLHLTLLGNIPLIVDERLLIKSVRETITNLKFEFSCFGINSNGVCTSVCCYPYFNIHELRQTLRKVLNGLGDDYTKGLDVYEYIGWINFQRFLTNSNLSIIKKLIDYQLYEFGNHKAVRLEIYKNTSKVLDNEKAKLIFSQDLN